MASSRCTAPPLSEKILELVCNEQVRPRIYKGVRAIKEHPPTVTGTPVRSDTFEDFVQATGSRMMRAAVLLTGDRDQAQDLLQSTYASVFAKWRQVSRAENQVAYARTMMTRIYLSDRRRKRVVELPLTTDAPAAGENTDLRVSLLAALATLAPLDRAVVVLRHWEDLSVPQVADQLGISESACRTRCSRALTRLRPQHPMLAQEED